MADETFERYKVVRWYDATVYALAQGLNSEAELGYSLVQMVEVVIEGERETTFVFERTSIPLGKSVSLREIVRPAVDPLIAGSQKG